MKAFHGSAELKEKFLDQIRAHAAADEIVKGQYWEHGKGCAVGCTIHGSDHSRYETKLGVPEMLARLEDVIFEGLPNGDAKAFPERFLNAIPVGADLSKVGIRFMVAVQERNYEQLEKGRHPEVEKAIQSTIGVLKDWLHGKLDKSAAWSARSAAESAARSAARSAAWSAESAAESAAWSAWSAWSARSARSSAESAARSAAWSAESAARSAAWSAESAARSAAWSAAYLWMANTLIHLLETA